MKKKRIMSRAAVQAVSPRPAVESRRRGVRCRCWPRPLVALPPWAGRARRSTSAAPPRAAPSGVPSDVGGGPRRWREAPQRGPGRAARAPPPPGPGRTRRCGALPPRPAGAVPVPPPLGPGHARLRCRGRAAPPPASAAGAGQHQCARASPLPCRGRPGVATPQIYPCTREERREKERAREERKDEAKMEKGRE